MEGFTLREAGGFKHLHACFFESEYEAGGKCTGPLSRGDYGVVAAHEETIAQYHPEFLETYVAVSRLSGHVLAADPAAVLGHLERLPRHSPLLSKSKGGSA